tara:strand:- start:257 stop:412 length:156 start_codon:yes stop_codon:yes gene_type:complete
LVWNKKINDSKIDIYKILIKPLKLNLNKKKKIINKNKIIIDLERPVTLGIS